MKANREMMSEQEVTTVVKAYFGDSLKKLKVYPSVKDFIVSIVYTDFKCEANVMRELSQQIPCAQITMERELTDQCWMKAIDDMELNNVEVFTKDVSGNMNSFTIIGLLIDYMRGTDFN